jgi:6-phosphogluconolactonase
MERWLRKRYSIIEDPGCQYLLYEHLSSSAESATKYSQRILTHFKKKPLQFDLVLLGLGDDAHTASLFPNTPVLKEQKALVKAVYLEDRKVNRITLTAPLINEAHNIAFLVYGESKAKAVQEVLKGKRDIENYPAS